MRLAPGRSVFRQITVRNLIRIGVFVCPLGGLLSSTVAAQDLTPGVYTPAPVGVNVVTMVGNINDGNMTFDPSLPVEEGHATIGAAVVAYNRTLEIAGRFASVGVVAPYVLGHVDGILFGEFQETSRAGLGDLSTRVAINLFGAPAMTLQQFAAYRPTTVLRREPHRGCARRSVRSRAGHQHRHEPLVHQAGGRVLAHTRALDVRS